jgi:AraC family transcriptional regulator, positive regulator of tynA and feaB
MQTLFSTDGVPQRDRFRLWRDICEDRLVPMAQQRLEGGAFQAVIEGCQVGGLGFTKFSLQNLHAATTPQMVRHPDNKTDRLFMSLVLAGSVKALQNDKSAVSTTGDFSIRDTNAPWTIEHSGYSEVLAIEIPRDKIESIIGPARHFAGLIVGRHLPVAALARSFLCDLARTADQLEPHSLRGSLIVQRAKSYISANFSDPRIGPAEVASAAGVSLRQLQMLFRENGDNIAAWIWQRRLEMASRRLSDPGCSHLSLGELAFECGFSDQAHFSRRFRNHFGLSPRDYRHAALTRQA